MARTPPPAATQRPYEPVGAALTLFYAQDPEVVLDGPAGTGKSRACLEKLNAIACKYPGCRILIVRKTRASLTQTAMVTFEQHVLPVGTKVRFHSFKQEYRYPNGSVIVVGGMDKPIKVMSAEYDVVYVQEATELSEDAWESITTRLRNGVVPYQQLIADVNPAYPSHWLNQRLNAGRARRILSRHEDNPSLWDRLKNAWTTKGAAYIAKLDALTGVRYLRLRLGKWVAADGQVYTEWDAKIHLRAALDLVAAGLLPARPEDANPDRPATDPPARYIPASWSRYRSIDFGYTNPFCCQWWAEDPDGRLIRYRELYGTGRLVDDWATDIYLQELDPRRAAALRTAYRALIAKKLAAARPTDPPPPDTDAAFIDWARKEHPGAFERITASLADHDAEDRATLARRGIHTTAALKEVSPGIQAVQVRLRPAGDGHPRLFLLADSLVVRDPALDEKRRPTCTEEEIDGYVWAAAPDGKPAKEEPVKKDDHGLDPLRYMVYYRDVRRKRVHYDEDESIY